MRLNFIFLVNKVGSGDVPTQTTGLRASHYSIPVMHHSIYTGRQKNNFIYHILILYI